MYSVKLDSNKYFTGSYASVGLVEGGVDIETLPPDMSKAIFYKYDYNEENILDWIFDDTKYNQYLIEKLSAVKDKKIKELGKVCSDTIHAGIDVTMSNGVEHFSLTEVDQANIKNAYDISKATQLDILYHADGAVCRVFTVSEITKIYINMMEYVTYNTTLCNMLNTLVRRSTAVEEIEAINYGTQLPQDLNDLMQQNLSQAALVINVLTNR